MVERNIVGVEFSPMLTKERFRGKIFMDYFLNHYTDDTFKSLYILGLDCLLKSV